MAREAINAGLVNRALLDAKIPFEDQSTQADFLSVVNITYSFFSRRELGSRLELSVNHFDRSDSISEWQMGFRNELLDFIGVDYNKGMEYNPDGGRQISGEIYPTKDAALKVHIEIGNGMEVYFLEFS